MKNIVEDEVEIEGAFDDILFEKKDKANTTSLNEKDKVIVTKKTRTLLTLEPSVSKTKLFE